MSIAARPDGAAGCLLIGMMGFIGQHALFGPAAATPFLATDLFGFGALGNDEPVLARFDLIEEEPPGEETVQALLPGSLTFYLQAGQPVEQHYTGCAFIDVLAAMPTRTDKSLVDVRLLDPQGRHAPGELGFFVLADGK